MSGRVRFMTMAAAVAATGTSLAAPAPASAALLPGYYVIRAHRPPNLPARDHRVFDVTALTSSTSQPVRLQAPMTDPIQAQRQQWQLDQQSISFGGDSYTAYVLVNRYYRGCLTWIAPLMGNGTRVGLAAYPQGCGSWPQRWVLNNGSRWVTISDASGTRSGFQMNIPVRTGLVYCLDVTGFAYAAGNHLQEWRCTGNWNQTFYLRKVAG